MKTIPKKIEITIDVVRGSYSLSFARWLKSKNYAVAFGSEAAVDHRGVSYDKEASVQYDLLFTRFVSE